MPKKSKTLCVDDLRHAEYYGMQGTFDELYQKSQNGEVFENLMDLILSRDNILLAYRNIKANKGSYTAGTDKKNITDIGSQTPDDVVKRVRFIVTGSEHGYRPKPVRRKDIPKPNGKTRPLGIPCIWDRLIQQCIKQIMEPICEAKFCNNSYGFRPNRSVEHAINRTYTMLQMMNLHYVIEFDIKGFFDNVNHSKLIRQIWSLGIYGYTAQQTLDYVQSLYEKKLATYPRTDSQYLTKDMQATAASLILWLRDNMPFGKGCAGEPDIDRVTDDSKVTDHHAIIPTVEIARTDLSELPSGERDVLTLLAVRLLCATTQVHRFEAVTAILDCQGYTFTAKGKTILQSGWKEVERIHRMSIRQSETEHKENEDAALPVLQEGQTFETVSANLREGKTSPPKHYTEDTLLSAMETAGAEDMPEDAERKGLGTPATRAATLEKLVSAGFVQRKKKQLIPTEKGKNLIAVLPDNIKSPILTAEWESMLKQVEHGELSATSFMDQIADMSRTLVKEHTTPEERFADLFPSSKGTAHEAVGVCPRCGAPVFEGKKGFFCDNRECSFALWKDNRFFSSKKKSITKSVAAALLKEGRISMSGLYSEKTGRTYDAEVILDDTGGKYVNFKLEFPVKKGRRK